MLVGAGAAVDVEGVGVVVGVVVGAVDEEGGGDVSSFISAARVGGSAT